VAIGKPSISDVRSVDVRTVATTVGNIRQRIEGLEAALATTSATANASANTGSTQFNVLRSLIAQLQAEIDALVVSGGAAGPAGPSGPPLFIPGEDGEDGFGIPGSPGAAGAAGPAGAAGAIGQFLLMEGERGEDGFPIPGTPGAAGAAGANGTIGVDGAAVYLAAEQGESGEPGPAGPTGPQGASSSAGPSGTAGRLTLTTGVPVTTADVTAATTVYWTPYKGNQVQLWDGAAWVSYTSAEISIALGTLTAALCYDVFMYQNAGAPTLEILAWTSATARATAVTLQDGRYCKSGDKTRLYLGTFYTTSTTTTEDSGGGVTTQVGGKRFLWNYYNRVKRSAAVIDTTDSWVYTTATIRQANAAAGNKVEYLVGIAEDACEFQVHCEVNRATATTIAFSGIGMDSTTVFSGQLYGSYNNNNLGVICGIHSSHAAIPAVGYHYAAWLEKGANTTCTFFGDDGADGTQSGLIAIFQS
jgi:hypothetical protein